MPITSRLFHSVVLLGCALVAPACADGGPDGESDAGDTNEAGTLDAGSGPTDAANGVADAGNDGHDAGDLENHPLDAGEHDAGWHPTK
jgi:hypothetical protein